MHNIFQVTIKVTKKDIDTLHHVNNAVYVKWMYMVAYKHWAFLTNGVTVSDCVWVVKKHEIAYLKPAFLGDEITVKTWVGNTQGFKSERLMEFYKEDVLLVTAKTTWGMLSASTNKPKRINKDVYAVLYPES